MKRIIFSLFTTDLEEHPSANDYKRQQFTEWYDQIYHIQENYAKICGADYQVFETSNTNYVNLQMEKILKTEELTKQYDEVLYLDFDVLPATKVNFFEKWDLDSACAYEIRTVLSDNQIKTRIFYKEFSEMDMYAKSCQKISMLLLDDITGRESCINTGILGMNKKSAKAVDFTNRIDYCYSKFEEAKIDNVYPEDISSVWEPNNEVFFSYLIERFDIPFTNIGLPWNFILDHKVKDVGAGQIYHVVNKDFGVILQDRATRKRILALQ